VEWCFTPDMAVVNVDNYVNIPEVARDGASHEDSESEGTTIWTGVFNDSLFVTIFRFHYWFLGCFFHSSFFVFSHSLEEEKPMPQRTERRQKKKSLADSGYTSDCESSSNEKK
jgi:hypothetical protein